MTTPLPKPKKISKQKKGEHALPEEVSTIISDLLVKDDDPFNAPTFNSIDYINQIFPNEESLGNLDVYIQKTKTKMSTTESEVLRSVREQMHTGSRGKVKLEESKRSIQDLFFKINDIKSKAEKSEQMVTEICRDIKTLDSAKRNLMTTITTLTRVQALSDYVDQLENFFKTRQYGEIAKQLGATIQLLEHFAPYMDIPRISNLKSRYETTFTQLKKEIRKDFKEYLENEVGNTQLLFDQCKVIENGPAEEKKDFILWVCQEILSEYNKYFKPGEESSQLQHTDRRLSWLKKTLRNYDELYKKIFPESWKMDQTISLEFSFQTRDHFSQILEANRATLSAEVLIGSLKKILTFEREMGDKFGAEKIIIQEDEVKIVESDDKDEEDEVDLSTDINPQSAQALRAKWKKYLKEQNMKEQRSKQKVKEKSLFQGVISSVFDLYMDVYLNQLERDLESNLQTVLGEEKWIVDDDERTKVLLSSVELVGYWTKLVQDLTKITKGKPMLSLFLLLKKFISRYAAELERHLPSSRSLSETEQKKVCLIINTAEYSLNNIIPGMTSTFQQLLEIDVGQNQLDLDTARNEFATVIAKGSQCLVSGLITQCDVAFQNMLKMPWSTWESHSDESPFVGQISQAIQTFTPLVKNWLTVLQHYRFFVDSFILQFTNSLTECLYKLRKVSESGGRQLVFDFNAIENILLAIPELGHIAQKRVKKEMKKIHSQRLKFINFPLDSDPVLAVKDYMSIVSDHSAEDLEKMLEAKSVGRNEIKNMLDAYNKQTGGLRKKILGKDNPVTVPNILTLTSDLVDNTARLFSFSFKKDPVSSPAAVPANPNNK